MLDGQKRNSEPVNYPDPDPDPESDSQLSV